MRKIAALLVLLVGVAAGWMALQAVADDPDRRGLVVGVVDGDTVDVRVLATRERVRVLGIDTPETGSCLSRRATTETNRLTLGRLVNLQRDPSQPERDRFDRLLAYVELPGERDLGLELVKRGLARVFVVGRPFKRLEAYRKAESLGRAQSQHLELLRSSIALDMRRLAIALSGALLVAGVFAGPVGSDSTVENAQTKPVRLCQKF